MFFVTENHQIRPVCNKPFQSFPYLKKLFIKSTYKENVNTINCIIMNGNIINYNKENKSMRNVFLAILDNLSGMSETISPEETLKSSLFTDEIH